MSSNKFNSIYKTNKKNTNNNDLKLNILQILKKRKVNLKIHKKAFIIYQLNIVQITKYCYNETIIYCILDKTNSLRN
ncbi:hypothetical protein CVS40_12750 [Lucilia cuprina]|nr:hypothetical protein CVS40_12750 [Lucilia cuprina]